MSRQAFICGLAGGSLSRDERDFLRSTKPAGIILFARNVSAPPQLESLISDARDAVGEEKLLVLIDQEGGRVQRLGPPHWQRYPAASVFSRAFGEDLKSAERLARLGSRLIASDLHELGINTSCAPVLDIPVEGADKVIGDRAYGMDAATVTRLGGAAAEGLLAGGVLPVMKHIPGHGRAKADSHFALPVIDAALDELTVADFAPFAALNALPMAMTAHVILTAIDPEAAVTISAKAVQSVIRELIGFDGLLMSDDVSMAALSGTIESRVTSTFAAGCDLALHCNGKMEEMLPLAENAPLLEGKALARFEAAFAQLRKPEPFDRNEARRHLLEMLAPLS